MTHQVVRELELMDSHQEKQVLTSYIKTLKDGKHFYTNWKYSCIYE